MKQYLDLLGHIRSKGRMQTDRTGTGSQSVFGYQMRFDLREGFPLVTTKKVYLRAIIHELLWFLKGSTDNTELEALEVKIWDAWALKHDVVEEQPIPLHERIHLLSKKLEITYSDAQRRCQGADEFLDAEGIPKTRQVTIAKRGALGPIYGKQWRAWPGRNGTTIDQIATLINDLRTRPFSRRLIVTAWNPTDMPDESASHHDNVVNDLAGLASCHCLFQFHVEQLTLVERIEVFRRLHGENHMHIEKFREIYAEFEASLYTVETGVEARERADAANAVVEAILAEYKIPDKRLSCQLYQRKHTAPLQRKLH